jgi:ubiquinone/menaquinone biosynthesis C-methylase UbiE
MQQAVQNTAAAPAPDLGAVKARQQAAWSSGDYAEIGTRLNIVGESLCEAVDLRAGSRVLDVAAGNGNASLAAARRFARVTASDYVPALLERAAERARADRLEIECREADAEQLPFADGSFDVVLSTFGVMFTPNQERAAAELARVCRPGGKIGLANWTPESFIGQLFKTLGKYLPPPAGVKSPALWGTQVRLAELFADKVESIDAQSRDYVFRYQSPAHWLEVFRTWYGPVHKAFGALDADKQKGLAEDIEGLLNRLNRAKDGTLVLPSEYLEVVAVRA